MKVVQGGEPAQDYRQCRRMLVGPGVNQPEPYPGYRGFVGWQSPLVLQDGTMLVGFSSGYWHASPPTAYFLANPAARDEWKKIGMPTDIDAPRGGRAELIRSTDSGKTWSRPTVLLDTPWDDRAPNFCQLQDGTILCSLFTYPGPTGTDLARDPAKTPLTAIIRSFDNGRTWEQQPKRLPVPFVFDATDGPIIQLRDGSALICVYGRTPEAKHDMVAFCRSADSGNSWELLSTLSTDHEMSETAVAQLPDGRLVLISRPEGDIAWSADGGRSWTKPVSFGIRLFEPRLMALRDGTLLCLHGSYGQVVFERCSARMAAKRGSVPMRSGASPWTRQSTAMAKPWSYRTVPFGPSTFTPAGTRQKTRKPKPSGQSACASDTSRRA